MNGRALPSLGLATLLGATLAGPVLAADSPTPGSSDPAFREILRQNAPLTPDEIRQYRHVMNEKQRATYGSRPPTLRQTQDVVHLGGGAAPLVVRVAPGYSGALVVTDITGAPWPVTHHKVASKRFLVEHPGTKAGNTLIVTPRGYYGSTDLLIFLKGLDTPVAVRLVNDPRSMDLSTRLVVARPGPNARPPEVGPAPAPVVTDVQERFLAGIPPAGAKRLRASKDYVSAWAFGGRYFIRTREVLASPAHLSLSHGEDGVALYEVAPVPVLIVDHGGKSVMVTLEEPDDGR
ncbi:MAG: hypothetical protein M0Z25_09375 [Nitrospiraceae bacterium]|nr:hypothetical protein [Nitrospiraceae bacterium]